MDSLFGLRGSLYGNLEVGARESCLLIRGEIGVLNGFFKKDFSKKFYQKFSN